MTTAIYNKMAQQIISEQALIIGPLAWSEAKKVQGLRIDLIKNMVTVETGNPGIAVNNLVAQYERLFGRASHEVCREAVIGLIAEMSATDVPLSLR